MPTERMEVEVVQPKLGTGPARRVENGPDVWLAEVYPGSLTAARLRLADAAEALWSPLDRTHEQLNEAWAEFHAALAALRTKRAGG